MEKIQAKTQEAQKTLADEQAKLQATIEAKGLGMGEDGDGEDTCWILLLQGAFLCDVVEGNFGIPDPMMLRYDATNHGNRGVSEQHPGWLMMSLRVIQPIGPIVFGILITRELGILMNQAVWIQPSAKKICQEKTQIQSELKNKDAEMQQQVGTRLWKKKVG